VSYAGVWRGQTRLDVDAFLVKAKELGFTHVELMAKRPHVSPLDYDAAARERLRARVDELGLKIACLAGYSDFTAGAEKPGIPSAEIGAIYVGELARLARDLDCSCVRVFTGYERPGGRPPRRPPLASRGGRRAELQGGLRCLVTGARGNQR
jgi:sugar phosphate isomerase/epimerase